MLTGKVMISYSVFHIEQKMEFEKFNCFFVDFLRYSFRRIIFIWTVAEKEYALDITQYKFYQKLYVTATVTSFI